jgi:hypothetical protein
LITFGGASATNVLVSSATTITATTPAHAAGAVDVVITNGDGSQQSSTGAYTYTCTAPATPIASAATNVLSTSLTTNWASSSGATSYRLDVSADNTFSSFVTGYNDLNVGNVLTYRVTGLACSTAYYYRVRAVSSCGTSVSSGTITTATAISVPVAIAATGATQSQFTANWNATTEAASYRLDVSTDNTFSSMVTGYNNLNVGNVTTYNITGLICNTSYYYRVRAVNGCGTSGNSNTISISTLSATAPAIGQSYQGGYVVYILQSGDAGYVAGKIKGLIVTTSNLTYGLPWGCEGTSIATSTAIGTGAANTSLIISQCTSTGIAARECDNLVQNDYCDWYLPSKEELGKLYPCRVNIGLTTGYKVYYWSSSESSANGASVLDTETGTFSGFSKRAARPEFETVVYLRAVRTFCYPDCSAPAEAVTATVTTSGATAVTSISSLLGGSVTSEGNSGVHERGLCWSTSPNPNVSNSKIINGFGIGSYSYSLQGLTPGTTYYVRAFATNYKGTSYGNQISFTTLAP